MIEGVLYVGAGGVLLVLCIGALVELGEHRLKSHSGIRRDGPPLGSRPPAPPGIDQHLRPSGPYGQAWRYLLFTEPSLPGYPSLLVGIRRLQEGTGISPVLVTCRSIEATAAAVQGLGLELPLVGVPPSLCERYGVRVTPFGVVVDDSGRVRARGLVNAAEPYLGLWKRAHTYTFFGE